VLLETGWLHIEDQQSIAAAPALAVHGIELADAMHLSSRPPGAAEVSLLQILHPRKTRRF